MNIDIVDDFVSLTFTCGLSVSVQTIIYSIDKNGI